MTWDDSQGSVEIRVGKSLRRIHSVTAERAIRTLIISDSVVTRADIGRNISKETFKVYAYEWQPGERVWEDDAKKIGALNTEQMLLSIALPPDAFEQLWAPRDASTRLIQVKVKIEPIQESLIMTEVTLIEVLSAP